MKNSMLAAAFSLVGLGLLACPWARADSDTFMDLRSIPALQGDPAAGKAGSATCAACHMQNGISVVGLFPNLAGQHAEYLYWRMRTIQQEARADSPMTALLADLDDAELRNFSAWYASLPPADHSDSANGAAAHASEGARIWNEGDATRGIPPCQGCHGRNAEGHPLAAKAIRWRLVPVLRGQHADFVIQRLKAYRDGSHTLTSSARMMNGAAANLDDASIEALAQWIESGDSM
ncbi:MAG: c-type cytochrome [Gammaproteobacteria bacterium]|nr:MAG: c-type cytochrome [Gammaproteobacteria bacterium]